MSDMKSCPFCGGAGHLDDVNGGKPFFNASGVWTFTNWHYHVICEKCASKTGEYEIPSDAIEAWNRRKE